MKANEAKKIAKQWVEEEAMPLPGFQAAHLSGSLNQLSDDADLPDFADIDIYCVMDEGHCFPQKKFRYQGALLETVSYSLSVYQSPETILSNPFQAHNFLHYGILADPTGLLASHSTVVKRDFVQPKWLQARYLQLKSTVLGVISTAGDAKTLNEGFVPLFRSLRLLSNLILIAHLQPPTVRKSICHAQRVLAGTPYASLSDELLSVLGSDHFSKDQVLACLHDCTVAFDRAVEVYHDPANAGFNLSPAVRPYLVEGSMEMIDAGEHREAMLWIAVMHWTANQALQTDAPEAERPVWQNSIDRLYTQFGLRNETDLQQRFERLKAVAANVIQRTDAVVGMDSANYGDA